MLEAIKQAAKEAVDASNPVAVMFGTVVNTNPLSVNVDQRFTIDADFLIQTESTKELKVNIGGIEYIIRPALQVGDRVVLLRVQGGQRYVIIDRE